MSENAELANPLARRYVMAWALALMFYFLEYAARSSPAVMIPQLSAAFGTTAVGVSAIIGDTWRLCLGALLWVRAFD